MRVVLLFHLIGACIWVGGHLVLLFAVLPPAMRNRDPGAILAFEHRYERFGIPALLIQVVTGLWLADRYVPGVLDAFRFQNPVQTWVAMKLLLLAATVITGLHARLRLIPRLGPERLPMLAAHIVVINLLGLGFVAVGVWLRTGG